MSDRVPPIARIRLSRSLPRLLALPALGLVVGAAAIAGGLLAVAGPAGIAMAVAGGLIVLAALIGAATLLSIRLDVEEAAVRVRWAGGERVYGLIPGPVTRVRFRGDNASHLRAARRFLPWQMGRAILRHEEPIEIVRLAPTDTAILVPTDRGRLAIAAADEGALLDALSRAARARERLEELTRASPPIETLEQAVEALEVDPVIMTGIERAIFERRMAEEREAALAAAEAEAERLAASEASLPEVAEPAAEHEPGSPPSKGRRVRLPRPAWTVAPGPSLAVLVLPLIGTGALWGITVLLDRMPAPSTDLGRLTGLALVLAGPATTVGAIMARAWWPRLVAVVVASGLASTVFIGRALLG